MLKPVKMQKVRIFATSNVLGKLIEELHEMGIMEMEQVEYPELKTRKPLETHGVISQALVKIRAMESMLPKKYVEGKRADYREAIKIVEKLSPVYDELARMKNELEELDKRKEMLEEKEEEIKLFVRAGFETKDLPRSLDFFMFALDEKTAKKQLKKIISDLKQTFENIVVETKKSGPNIVGIIGVEKGGSPAIILGKYGIGVYEVPRTGIEEESKRRKEELEEIKDKKTEIEKALNKIAEEYYEDVVTAKESLKIAADRAEIAARFGFSKKIVVIEGWIVASRFAEMEKRLYGLFGDRIHIEKIEGKNPPTLLDNPGVIKPFEFLVKFYSLPKGKEFDPSIIFAFTIPLMYGMIIGDVGYALISIWFARFLMKKWPSGPVYWFSKIWEFSAIGGIIWGVIFDEWFGASHAFWLGISEPLYHGFHRMALLPYVVVASILMGMFHLTIGFVLGAIKEWHHSKKHAIGKISWILTMYGGLLAITTYLFPLLPQFFGEVGVAMLAFGVGATAATEGVAGMFEIPGVLGNILSYARIAAVGVAGVVLAELINKFFVPSLEAGLLNLIILPLFIALHFANAVLAMFESLVQGGRLNLVEFSSKFFEGGGRAFKPFAVYTQKTKR
ncbi:MAG: V-type ATPase 116kDa subunit family protein [Candidatus Anstonellales archaeon]